MAEQPPAGPVSHGRRARLVALWRQRCPRCLRGRVFLTDHWREMRMYYACPSCRVIYGRENGYFTGAMIFSYVIAVPLAGALFGLVWLVAGLGLGWGFEWLFVATVLALLPFAPALFRYSRVAWMHFDRLVDSDPENERYVPPGRPIGRPARGS
jgi:uncharacterized protein (DUF983 family)